MFSLGMSFLLTLLFLLPGCGNRQYDEFKKPRKEKTFREKKSLMYSLKKKKLTKHIKDMNIDEALEAKSHYQELGREDMVMVLIPRIIALSQDVSQVAELNLELADLHLAFGEIEEAQKLYTNFISFYPGNSNIKAARYRQLLTIFWSSLEPDRDQSLTIMAIDHAKKYLQDFPEDGEYGEKVHDILKNCYKKVLESELNLIKFYINKFRYERRISSIDAARLRLENAKQKIVPLLATYDQRALSLLPDLISLEHIEINEAAVPLAIRNIEDQIQKIGSLLQPPLDQKPTIHPRDMF